MAEVENLFGPPPAEITVDLAMPENALLQPGFGLATAVAESEPVMNGLAVRQRQLVRFRGQLYEMEPVDYDPFVGETP